MLLGEQHERVEELAAEHDAPDHLVEALAVEVRDRARRGLVCGRLLVSVLAGPLHDLADHPPVCCRTHSCQCATSNWAPCAVPSWSRLWSLFHPRATFHGSPPVSATNW